MNRLHHPLLCVIVLLLLLTAGCSCKHEEQPVASVDEKAALTRLLIDARPSAAVVTEPSLHVTVIDVGQGDSILLVSPEGKTMLVDAGPDGAYDRVSTELKNSGVSSLDVVVATHPHEDHIGSMADVLDAYPVGAYYTIKEDQAYARSAEIRAALERNGCSVYFAQAGMTIPWAESCTVTVLNPIPAYADFPTETNDLSVVLHVRCGETSVLLMGDAESTAENRMLDTFPRSMLAADVIKLGHHGSSSSSDYAFLLAVDPDYAVASCGVGNDYDHPHYETLSLLYNTHTAFYCTGLDGSVTFRLDGEKVAAETTRKELP